MITNMQIQERPQQLVNFELRDYQKRCVREIFQMWISGMKAPLLFAATGSGKTAMATYIIEKCLKKGYRVLFLVHRETLIAQTVRALAVYGIDAGFIKAGYPDANNTHRCIIASIQTLSRRQLPENIRLVVVDECHTVAWYQSYTQLKGKYISTETRFLGLSGSPFRTKTNEYMGQHFDSVVFAPSTTTLIEKGYLVKPRHFGWGGLADWSKLKVENGEFNQTQATKLTLDLRFNQTIVDKFRKVGGDRTAICFAQSVSQSRLLQRLFTEAGYTCEHLDADTATDERPNMYTRLAQGKTQILTSVGTLTEGFDEPSIGVVILARPTRSLALLIQMTGRGLRLSPEKNDCYLLDFCENFKRLGFIDAPLPVSLCPLPKRGKLSMKECHDCGALIPVFSKICPECGCVFPPKEKDGDETTSLPPFGELLTKTEKKKAKFFRSSLKNAYINGINPDLVYREFAANFGHYPPNLWAAGAIYEGEHSALTRNDYNKYLRYVAPIAFPRWYRFHCLLEFCGVRNPYLKDIQEGSQVCLKDPYLVASKFHGTVVEISPDAYCLVRWWERHNQSFEYESYLLNDLRAS